MCVCVGEAAGETDTFRWYIELEQFFTVAEMDRVHKVPLVHDTWHKVKPRAGEGEVVEANVTRPEKWQRNVQQPGPGGPSLCPAMRETPRAVLVSVKGALICCVLRLKPFLLLIGICPADGHVQPSGMFLLTPA